MEPSPSATVGDDRVRTEHARLDGLVRPKDDPIWKTLWPPNGWNCRCQLIELTAPQRVTRVPKTVEIEPGFAFNPGQLLGGGQPGDVARMVSVPRAPRAVPREFHSDQEIAVWAKENYQATWQTLSDAERSSVEQYAHKGNSLNGRLREGVRLTGSERKLMQRLDGVLRRAPRLQEPILVYRAVGGQMPLVRPGQAFPDMGFASTSLSRATAERDYLPAGGSLFHITVAKGSAGLYLGPFGLAADKEFLLPRGTAFEVVKVYTDRTGIQHVHLECGHEN